MDYTTFTVGAIGAGLVASCWGSVKGWLTQLSGLLVVRVIFQRQTEAVWFLANRCQPTKSAFLRVNSKMAWVKSVDQVRLVAFEALGMQTRLYWYGWRPLLVRLQADRELGQVGVYVTSLRWVINTEQFAFTVVDEFAKAKSKANFFYSHHDPLSLEEGKRFAVHRFCGEGRRLMGSSLAESPMERNPHYDGAGIQRPLGYALTDVSAVKPEPEPLVNLVLSDAAKEAVTEADRWFTSRKWFVERGVPWRRGWLLYGPPGTGKSSLARAIAAKFDMPICVFDLATMDNKEFAQFWRQAAEQTPCVILTEDFDAVFNGRKNIANPEGLTFDCLLNHISGVSDVDGVFLIMTTNHVETIDPALVTVGEKTTRPGRIDRAIELTALSEAGRHQVARRILGDYPDIETVVSAGHGETGAQFQERCTTLALHLFWEK